MMAGLIITKVALKVEAIGIINDHFAGELTRWIAHSW